MIVILNEVGGTDAAVMQVADDAKERVILSEAEHLASCRNTDRIGPWCHMSEIWSRYEVLVSGRSIGVV